MGRGSTRRPLCKCWPPHPVLPWRAATWRNPQGTMLTLPPWLLSIGGYSSVTQMDASRIPTTLESLIKAFKSDSAKGPATYAAATAKVLGGLKCRVTGPAGEQLDTDMPT